MLQVQNFDDFVSAVRQAGFSMGGGNDEGIFAAVPFSWNEEPPYETKVRWHTGDPQTDPWEWRMRVLDERGDIAYAKVFFRKSGYITREWYPYFLAARRGGASFEQAYADGAMSAFARRIYEVVRDGGAVALHDIKRLGGFAREDASAFDRALTDLQMKLYITMCGRRQKLSSHGEEYGWSSTVFCTAERFFGEELCASSEDVSAGESAEKITAQIYTLNPDASPKKITKFIMGCQAQAADKTCPARSFCKGREIPCTFLT